MSEFTIDVASLADDDISQLEDIILDDIDASDDDILGFKDISELEEEPPILDDKLIATLELDILDDKADDSIPLDTDTSLLECIINELDGEILSLEEDIA